MHTNTVSATEHSIRVSLGITYIDEDEKEYASPCYTVCNWKWAPTLYSPSVACDYFFSFIRLRDYVNTEAHLLIMVCVDDAIRGYLNNLLLCLWTRWLLLLDGQIVYHDLLLTRRQRSVLLPWGNKPLGSSIRWQVRACSTGSSSRSRRAAFLLWGLRWELVPLFLGSSGCSPVLLFEVFFLHSLCVNFLQRRHKCGIIAFFCWWEELSVVTYLHLRLT